MEEENLDELLSCLSEEEKNKIMGKNKREKFFKKIAMKREAKRMEKYEDYIDTLKKDNIDDIIPDEYKKG